jgi:hypothetical protein
MSSPEQPQTHDDDALLHQVDTALRGTSTEHPVIDLLARHRPAARPAFQRGLEEMLMARLDEDRTTEGTTPMKLPYLPKRKRIPGRVPLALIAAILGFVFGGGLLLIMGPRMSGEPMQSASYYPCKIQRSDWNNMYIVQSGDTLAALASRFGTTVDGIVAVNCLRNPNLIDVGTVLRVPDGSFAPIPVIPTPDFPTPPTIPGSDRLPVAVDGTWRSVVIAVRDIPVNAMITSNMVALVNWSPEAVAAFATNQMPGSDVWLTTTLEDVVGLYATRAIPAWQPIAADAVRSELAPEVSLVIGSHGTPDYECGGMSSERAVVTTVAQQAAEVLTSRGYTVNVLVEGNVAHYPGDVVVALYTDACEEDGDNLSGYLVTGAASAVPESATLMNCLANEYGKFASIERRDYAIADNEQYTLNSQIRAGAVQAVIKLGSLKNDLAALQDTKQVGRGIAESIACYFGMQSMSSKLPNGQVAIAIPYDLFVAGSRDLQVGDNVSVTASLVVINDDQQPETLDSFPGEAVVPLSSQELAQQQAQAAQAAAELAQQQAQAAQVAAELAQQQALEAQALDPFVLTATAFVGQITQTANTEIAATAISNGSLDPHLATATAIIADATQMAQAVQLENNGSAIDPFIMTATAFVAEITQTAQAAQFPVVNGTQSPQPANVVAPSSVQTAQVELDAQIMSITDDATEDSTLITLSLSPQDAVTLTWLLEANVPLTISLQR